MRKKQVPPPAPLKIEFRESDFAGMKPQDKEQLSGALNQLSRQLVVTRKLLHDIKASTAQEPRIDDDESMDGGIAMSP